MSLSSKFDNDVCRRLTDRVDTYDWKTQVKLDDSTRERVDVGGKSKSRRGRKFTVYIEAELRREDPVSNILKVWARGLKSKSKDRIIFCQGFSRAYRSKRYSNRRIKGKYAVQFGEMMQEHSNGRIWYFPIRIDYLPVSGKHEGNGARRNAAVRFAERIVLHLRKKGVRSRAIAK